MSGVQPFFMDKKKHANHAECKYFWYFILILVGEMSHIKTNMVWYMVFLCCVLQPIPRP